MFAVAAIGSMMSLAGSGSKRREGTRMGLWGAAQAIAAGFGENVAKKYFQYEVIWITIFIMGLLGLLFDITLRKIIDKTIPWRGKG